MNFFYRIGIGLIVCSAVACSKDETETAAPVAEPETVVIGCSGAAGVDADVRTQLADDGLSVRWASGDEIRFWAREHKEPAEASPTYIIEKEPFRFDYYSPSWSRAGFTGTISGVESKFDRAKTYDYFAVSPAPASVVGTRATYTIPALQAGDYDGLCDIMTAQLPDTTALQAGDNNLSINLKFKHHIHLLRFKIESNAWEKDRPVRAVELTFPCAVVGALTVDAADSTVNVLAPEGEDAGNKLLIKFPAGKERKVGETFYAMIVPPPTAFGSDAKIGMRIIGTLGETSDDVSVAGKTFEAGHTTPVKLKVKEMTTRYNAVTLTFNVTDGNGGMGENTLGERVKKVRVKGLAGAFSKAVDWSEGCSVSEDGSELACTVPSTGGDGIYSLTFLPDNEENSGYLWPGELWDSSIISNKTLEVEYESARALVMSLDGWKPVQTTIATINGSGEYSHTLSVPYLFEEDFSKVNGLKNELNLLSIKSASLENDKFYSSGWSGFMLTGYSNSIELKSKIECVNFGFAQSYGRYYGRLDSADILNYLKNKISSTNIKIYFEYEDFRSSTNKYEYKLYYDVTHNMDVIDPYYIQAGVEHNKGCNITTNEIPLPESVAPVTNDFDNCAKPARLSWQFTALGEKKATDESYLHIMNVRVSLR